MNRMLLRLAVGWTLIALGAPVNGQDAIEAATRSADLQHLSTTLHERDRQLRAQAQSIAQRLGIPLRRELPDGRVLELQRWASGAGPVFYLTNNLDAADTVSTLKVWPGGVAGLDLDGSGMTVAEWDGGAIYAAHPDFAGRLTQMDSPAAVSGHSTHVAGTLIGGGDWLEPRSRGMAYAAQLEAWDWNSDTAEMAAAAAGGLLFSNHSYGIAAGWLYLGGAPPDNWWWIGGANPSDIEDPNFGYYDAESALWDQIAYDAPYYLLIKAAGNDRSDIGPAPGEEYTVIDQDGNFLFTSTLPREPDCAPAGYDCLPTHSVAKNVLTIGAVDDIYGGYSPLAGPSQVVMAPFSSWGPSDDGRIKPDLVGNGVFLISAWPDSPYYAAAAGTSMAAPNVTGSLVLLQEHYQDLHGAGNFMRSATLKALAIHTADEAGSYDGPDYAFGWGLLNTRKAADLITEDGSGEHQIIEGSLANGATDSVPVNVTTPDATITATLVWMDPPGTPVAPSLDPPDLMLVNDLDLRVTNGPASYFPWVLDPAVPAAAATKGDNFRDNVEQVQTGSLPTGTYLVEVSHKGGLLGGLSQDYALIISVLPPASAPTGLIIDEDFSGGLPSGWSVFTVSGVDWTINDPVIGDARLDNGTGGSGKFAMLDNNWANQTRSYLRTPALDLSANDAAVLRFKSYYNYDTFESLNVDVSTDGGGNWINVWKFQGFNPFPTPYTLDISAAIAGQSNAMVAFRFDSEGWLSGDFWQVDDVQLEVFGGGPPPGDPPGQAGAPSPADGATGVAQNVVLGWSAGTDADSHDVYFGTDASPDGGEFQGNQAGTGFDPGGLNNSTTYYWRIDEVNSEGTTTGPVWSFTTEAAPPPLPGVAGNPSPGNGATSVPVNATLSWTAGSDTNSHDVYFGTNPALDAGDFQGNQAGASFDPGGLNNSITYYWRIDEVNTEGITTGAIWSFTTADALPPVESLHLADLLGVSQQAPRGRWEAVVNIVVADETGSPLANVDVSGDWSNGANGAGSCTTDGSGSCVVIKANLKGNTASVDFTVLDLTALGYEYNAGANEAPVTVTIFKDDPNLLPDAVDDMFATPVDTVLNDNVMANDDPGDAPATVTSFDAVSAQGFTVNVSPNGDFSYTPGGGFEGSDSFGYSITDNNGDADSAAVSITVGSPPANREVTTAPFKVKGVHHVEVFWSGFQTANVDIRRDGGAPVTVSTGVGSWVDNIGVKGGGVTYSYEVCEAGSTTDCASATASF